MHVQWQGIQAFRRRLLDASSSGGCADDAVGSRGDARPRRDAPDRLLPPPCTPLHLNLLLVGRQGVGKTTFMRNACVRWGMEPKDLQTQEATGSMMMSAFETQPDSMACCVPEILLGAEGPAEAALSTHQYHQATQRALRIRLQDTPGYGERDCPGPERPSRHLPAVLRWVLRQRQRDVAALNGAALSVADGGRRLGVLPYSPCLCIFMVEPNRFTDLDVEYLSALSRVVGVLPVLARADTLTAHERQQMRERVAAAMAEHTSDMGLADPVSTYHFSAQALDSIMGQPAVPTPHILSVLGSPEMVFTEAQPPKEPRQQQQPQQQRHQRHRPQHDKQEQEQEKVVGEGDWRQVPSSSSPPPAATAGRWVAVRRLGGDGSSAVLSAADPSLSDTELLLGLLRADLWGVAADARDRHIEFANRYKAARSRLPPLERDLLRHVAWHRLGAARRKPPSVVPAGPTDTCRGAGMAVYGGMLSPTVVVWVAMLGQAAVAGAMLYWWVSVQQKQAEAHQALMLQQQAAYREAMTTMVRQQAEGQLAMAEQAHEMFRDALQGAQAFMQWAKGAMLGQQAAYRDALQGMAQQQAEGQVALAEQTKRMFRDALQSMARQQTEGQLAFTGQQQQMFRDALQSMAQQQEAGQLALAGQTQKMFRDALQDMAQQQAAGQLVLTGQQKQDAYQEWIIKAVHGVGVRLKGAMREGLAACSRSRSWRWSGKCDT